MSSGSGRVRTDDLSLAKRMLSQLSYRPNIALHGIEPRFVDPKSTVLPLYERAVPRRGIEPLFWP